MPESISGSAKSGESRSEHFAAHYANIRALAARLLRAERRNHTLRTTELVHEVYLRLEREGESDEGGRFIAHAARACRRILVEHARRRAARESGHRANVDVADLVVRDPDWKRLLDLDEGIRQLMRRHERAAQVVEMRFFQGLTIAECAYRLGVTDRTVNNDWLFAQAWLRRHLGGRPSAHG
jgi:RNA polymerase sigma factor (TIGR02999 family)